MMRKIGVEVGHAVAVQFHHGQVQALPEQELGEHSHAWPHFQDGQLPVSAQRQGDAFSNVQIDEEVLSE